MGGRFEPECPAGFIQNIHLGNVISFFMCFPVIDAKDDDNVDLLIKFKFRNYSGYNLTKSQLKVKRKIKAIVI